MRTPTARRRLGLGAALTASLALLAPALARAQSPFPGPPTPPSVPGLPWPAVPGFPSPTIPAPLIPAPPPLPMPPIPIPPPFGPTPSATTNVPYGSDPAQVMDIYAPAAAGGSRPGAVLIHGGGWQGGDKSFYAPYARALAARGFVVFAVNYRLTPAARWPAQADDVQRAVRWVRLYAPRFGLDPRRMGALGDSAGGHLALILGTRDTRDNSDPLLAGQSSRVQCVVDFYGPTDLTAAVASSGPPATDAQKYGAGVLRDLLGGSPSAQPAAARAASPLFSVDSRSAPTLIITGGDDPLVPPDQSMRLAAALRRARVEWMLAVMYGEGHGFLKPANPGVYGAMATEWLTRHLRP